jgi:signal transduction histidine kinase/ActR/RegA family two-component response regulator
MPKPIQSRLIRYLLPFGAITAALLAQWGLMHVIPKSLQFPYAFFYLMAVFVVAWFGSYIPGVIATVVIMVGLPVLAAHGKHVNINPLTVAVFVTLSLIVSRVAKGQQRETDILADRNVALDMQVQVAAGDLASTVDELRTEVALRRESEDRLQTQLGRLHLLDKITRAIGERQDLSSIFQVVVRTLEDNLPIDFGCVCLYNPEAECLTVTCVGVRSHELAMELALTEQSRVGVGKNGLARCVGGQLVYEPDLSQLDFPFPKRLAEGGLGSVVAAPLRSESRIFGVLMAARRETNGFDSTDCEFLRQLSEHVAVAAHQAQIYTALQQAYDDLRRSQKSVMEQERLRVLGQMASGIAHDINNALSPVALYTESLLEKEPNLSERTRSYLETTQRAISDVAHTVGRMREFYRQREPQLTLAPVDLNALARQVLDLTRARWRDIPLQRGVVIRLETELDSANPRVSGIESEIREALTNLIFNAVDAMQEGGTLAVRSRTTAAGRVRIEVLDTGVGMDEETRRRCLEPFFTTKGERGTGLGLAMVYGVAQRQNAELHVESTVGVGTTVSLDFPPMTAVPAAKAARPDLVVSRLNILLVDDDPLIIRSMQSILEEDGHTVTTATGGQEGIDVFQTAIRRNEHFSIVITDLGMPYVDGRKVASAVKAASRETPVIMLTGWGQRLIDDDEIPEHVDRVLNKPPKLYQLRAALSELAPHVRDMVA